jgi:hypothetical protein
MRRLEAQDRERIIVKIEQYAGDPPSLANQVIKLTGSEYRRMRVGDYRVIFGIEHNQTHGHGGTESSAQKGSLWLTPKPLPCPERNSRP